MKTEEVGAGLCGVAMIVCFGSLIQSAIEGQFFARVFIGILITVILLCIYDIYRGKE